MNSVSLLLGISLCATAGAVAAQLDAIGFVDLEVTPGFSAIANPLGAADHSVTALFGGVRGGVPEGTAIFKFAEQAAANPPLPEDLEKALADGILSKFPSHLGGPVRIKLEAGAVVLEWSGTLHTGAEAGGPFELVEPASSPLTLAPGQARQFWLAQVAAGLSAGQFTANVFRSGAWSDPAQTLAPGEGALIFNPASTSFIVPFNGRILDGASANPIPAGWSLRANMLPLTGGLTSDAGLELAPGDHIFLVERGSLNPFTYQGGANWIPFEPQIRAARSFFIFASKPTIWNQDFGAGR